MNLFRVPSTIQFFNQISCLILFRLGQVQCDYIISSKLKIKRVMSSIKMGNLDTYKRVQSYIKRFGFKMQTYVTMESAPMMITLRFVFHARFALNYLSSYLLKGVEKNNITFQAISTFYKLVFILYRLFDSPKLLFGHCVN